MDALSRTIPEPLERLIERLRADTIFGPPETRGELTIIPVAEVKTRAGYGFGSGSAPEAAAEDGATPSGTGGGAGATGAASPRGFIELGEAGARWVPIEAGDRVALAGIALAAWIVFWVTFTVRAVARARAQRPR